MPTPLVDCVLPGCRLHWKSGLKSGADQALRSVRTCSRGSLEGVVEYRKGTRDMSIYEIHVRGRLDAHWATWFAGLTLAYEGETTVLRGFLADEAALHGVLSKVGNLNLHLLSVNVVETRDATADPSTGIGREPAAQGALDVLDVPPSQSAADTPPSKRKFGPRRKFRRK